MSRIQVIEVKKQIMSLNAFVNYLITELRFFIAHKNIKKMIHYISCTVKKYNTSKIVSFNFKMCCELKIVLNIKKFYFLISKKHDIHIINVNIEMKNSNDFVFNKQIFTKIINRKKTFVVKKNRNVIF